MAKGQSVVPPNKFGVAKESSLRAHTLTARLARPREDLRVVAGAAGARSAEVETVNEAIFMQTWLRGDCLTAERFLGRPRGEPEG